MKRKLLALILAMAASLSLAACGGGSAPASSAAPAPAGSSTAPAESAGGDADGNTASGGPMKITLITMDQMDVHWVKLEKAAHAKVDELVAGGAEIEYNWLAPEKKDNAQQIHQ